MSADRHEPEVDERTIDLIADRVAAILRNELRELVGTIALDRPLTVEDVAERFGVARSTVYAHWREWGGYKLGGSEKAPIRFPAESVRSRHVTAGTPQREQAPRRRETTILQGAPRLPTKLGDETPPLREPKPETARGSNG